MGALATAARIRHDLLSRLHDARSRTDEIFHLLRADALYERPIAERHRLIFYLGHVDAFDWNLLAERAFGLRSFHPSFDKLFAFGIDPVDGGLPQDQPVDWPARDEILAYDQRVRKKLDVAIEEALSHPSEGHPQLPAMLQAAIEHRLMHAETLAYLLHRLPAKSKIPGSAADVPAAARPRCRMVDIPAGMATLGLAPKIEDTFGWDNERDAHEKYVPGFAMDTCNVTNAEFLRFVQAGGYQNPSLWSKEGWTWIQREAVEHPAFWKREGNLWFYRAMFGDLPLPLDWPVYVSHAEAGAYAKWLGRRLPSEEQFHRAAYGTPAGVAERSYPWGEDAPAEQHGNFDFRRWDAAPTGSFPAGASAFGVHDLLGNGWEWTRTVFEPFPGFTPMTFYPGYSANFFDGQHYVMKGASPRTAVCMVRRSFRNWFQPHYPYIYATFRCVED